MNNDGFYAISLQSFIPQAINPNRIWASTNSILTFWTPVSNITTTSFLKSLQTTNDLIYNSWPDEFLSKKHLKIYQTNLQIQHKLIESIIYKYIHYSTQNPWVPLALPLDNTSIKESCVRDTGALFRQYFVRECSHESVCGGRARARQVDKVPDVPDRVGVVKLWD